MLIGLLLLVMLLVAVVGTETAAAGEVINEPDFAADMGVSLVSGWAAGIG